jgi:hypothetical protein
MVFWSFQKTLNEIYIKKRKEFDGNTPKISSSKIPILEKSLHSFPEVVHCGVYYMKYIPRYKGFDKLID